MSDNRKFNDVVESIKESENDVDKVLKAGRLERHEKAPMSKEMIAMLLNYAMGTIAMLLGFGLVYMFMYFAWTR